MIPISYPSIGEDELNAIKKVFENGWLGMGALVKDFENGVSEYLGARNVIAVNNGTSALHIALVSAGIKKGDEVIVPSFTYAASVQAIVNAGATPVFCDVEMKALNMCIKDALKKITKKTKAIMPVHYGGQPCDMDGLSVICKDHNIRLIEDAAHAFGTAYKGRKIGSFGDIACFSFDSIKIITCGDGGAVATNDDNLAQEVIKRRSLGIDRETFARYNDQRSRQPSWSYGVVNEGFRYQMNNINAAIGLAQLKKINGFIQRRQEIVKMYDSAFKDTRQIGLLSHDYASSAFLFYVMRVPKRDELIAYLKAKGITAGVHYIPNHMQPFFKKYSLPLPVTEKIFKEIITLPLYADITDEEARFVIAQVLSFLNE